MYGEFKGKRGIYEKKIFNQGELSCSCNRDDISRKGCEKRKRVPEDMTLGDEYLEKIVLASDVEERDFEEDGIRYHEFKTKKMIVTYPLIEKRLNQRRKSGRNHFH